MISTARYRYSNIAHVTIFNGCENWRSDVATHCTPIDESVSVHTLCSPSFERPISFNSFDVSDLQYYEYYLKQQLKQMCVGNWNIVWKIQPEADVVGATKGCIYLEESINVYYRCGCWRYFISFTSFHILVASFWNASRWNAEKCGNRWRLRAIRRECFPLERIVNVEPVLHSESDSFRVLETLNLWGAETHHMCWNTIH